MHVTTRKMIRPDGLFSAASRAAQLSNAAAMLTHVGGRALLGGARCRDHAGRRRLALPRRQMRRRVAMPRSSDEVVRGFVHRRGPRLQSLRPNITLCARRFCAGFLPATQEISVTRLQISDIRLRLT